MRILLAAVLMPGALVVAAGQSAVSHSSFTELLDTNVRDGYVYYRALKANRSSLDRYLAGLDVPADRVASWPRDQQIAFWVNAYNAIVLRTVINNYPIDGAFELYPPNSVRQVSGAFDGLRHPVGGRVLSLDEIETEVLAPFGDARVFLLLGRGAIDSSRLRSEAITASRLEVQLEEAVKECAARAACVQLDLPGRQVIVTPVIGWRADVFERTFVANAGERWPDRSPIERAVAAMIYPHVFDREQAFLDEDNFRMSFGDFDWRLNDLTGRGGTP